MTKTAKPIITPGYQVGHLTVIEATNKRKNNYMIWKCQCDCGNYIELDTRYLQRQTKTDCGCQNTLKAGVKDLSGQRFGKLVCIEPTTERKYKGTVVWKCQCDCGNECYASSMLLTKGYKKSCGCLKQETVKDYIGKQFGRLEVIGYEGKKNGMHQWLCKCECGNETVVGQTRLQNGKTKSCGCLVQDHVYSMLKLVNGTSVTRLETVKKLKEKNQYTGVYFEQKSRLWRAQIALKGKVYNLGSYHTKEEALKARNRGEEIHENFLEEYYSLTSPK